MPKMIEPEIIELLASLTHKVVMGKAEFPQSYDELPEDLKEVNRTFVQNLLRRLSQIGYSIIPRRIGGPPVVFSEDKIELLAEIEHLRWMAQKVSMGWTYGSQRDAKTKQHPCLVSWELLEDRFKEQNRAMMEEFIKKLQSWDFSIIRLETSVKQSNLTFLVFISASSADYHFAEKVHSFLISHGVETFFSKESLPKLGSSDYRKKIDEALDGAKHMIVVTSSARNVTSPWVEAEWGFFISEKRSGRKTGNLITITIGSLRPQDLPPSLRYYEVIPMELSLEKILAYIN